MNRKAMVRLALLLLWTMMIAGQELGVEVAKVENVTAGDVEQPVSSSVVVEDQGSQLKQDEEVKKAEDTSGIEAASAQNQGEKVQAKPEVAPDGETQNSPQPQTKITTTPQKPPTAVETANPTPTADSNPASEPTNPSHPHEDVLSNLTPQQQAKLLHEQSIRAQLHANQDLNLATLANLTLQQQVDMQKRLAEQTKAAYERGLKQKQDRDARERLQLEKLLKQAKLTKSKEVILRQRLKVRNLFNTWEYKISSINEFMFDMDPFTQQDFMISLPVTQQIAYVVSVYSNQDGVYIRPQEVDESQPLNLKIYENNLNIIHDENFYTENALQFQGREATYTFRFANKDTHRLIAFKVTHVLERKHLDGTITLNDVHSHSQRAKVLYNSMKNRFLGLDSTTTLENSNRRRLTGEIKTYYIYTLVEMAIFIGVVLVQIELIRKLLANASVV